MATINPYLTFNGECEEAFNFYKKAFKQEFIHISKFNEMPDFKDDNPELGNMIMHVSLPVSAETVLMGSDVSKEQLSLVKGNNISISINTESKGEADTLFTELSAGGKVTMALQNTFWGAYFGMFTDKFGIHWMINFDEKN
ncbi:MAG: VOC family protein [Bacteroidetes bacterium]|nr:VOC family protein [Bacteroidota bacterium]